MEIGGEAGAGAPGTAGVGGQWPALTYPDEAVMKADASRAAGTYCWCEGTGYVYQWSPKWARGAWFFLDPSTGLYYTALAQPRALLAKVTAVSGNILTLDTAASRAATNAHVWFDNAPVFNRLATKSDSTFVWPAGVYACGSPLVIDRLDNCHIAGAGQAATSGTVLKSPKGCVSVQISCCRTTGTEISDLRLAGNVFLNGGWGMQGGDALHAPYPQYAVWARWATSLNLHDVTVDSPWYVCDVQDGADCVYRRVTCNTEGVKVYVSWMFNFVNATNCWSYDCVVNSTWLTTGFECFASNNCGHVRAVGNNATFSLNSAGDCVLDKPKVILGAMVELSPSPLIPMINVNTNIPQNAGKTGNSVLKATLIQRGYVNANNDTLKGIEVSGASSGTLISGGFYAAPDYKAPSKLNGAQGVNANSAGPTTVRNFTVVGKAVDGGTYQFPNRCNIYVQKGVVTNPRCDTWYANGAHS